MKKDRQREQKGRGRGMRGGAGKQMLAQQSSMSAILPSLITAPPLLRPSLTYFLVPLIVFAHYLAAHTGTGEPETGVVSLMFLLVCLSKPWDSNIWNMTVDLSVHSFLRGLPQE